MSSTGQAWQDELQSFLPHSLDCVDPKCVLPLCVNLKLTLRHAQHCEKGEQCHICQGMKTLAATHSNSCRNYYCNVPFCFQAKVATQQQMLMDELEKATQTVVDLRCEQVSQVLLKQAGDKCQRQRLRLLFSSSACHTNINNFTRWDSYWSKTYSFFGSGSEFGCGKKSSNSRQGSKCKKERN